MYIWYYKLLSENDNTLLSLSFLNYIILIKI